MFEFTTFRVHVCTSDKKLLAVVKTISYNMVTILVPLSTAGTVEASKKHSCKIPCMMRIHHLRLAVVNKITGIDNGKITMTVMPMVHITMKLPSL